MPSAGPAQPPPSPLALLRPRCGAARGLCAGGAAAPAPHAPLLRGPSLGAPCRDCSPWAWPCHRRKVRRRRCSGTVPTCRVDAPLPAGQSGRWPGPASRPKPPARQPLPGVRDTWHGYGSGAAPGPRALPACPRPASPSGSSPLGTQAGNTWWFLGGRGTGRKETSIPRERPSPGVPAFPLPPGPPSLRGRSARLSSLGLGAPLPAPAWRVPPPSCFPPAQLARPPPRPVSVAVLSRCALVLFCFPRST